MSNYEFTINVKDPLLLTGLQPYSKGRLFLMNEIIRLSDDYTPFDTGVLKNNITKSPSGKWFEYNTPYARYLWYGKLMVDPITKKGAFHDPKTGRFWSRPNTPKELTDRDLKFRFAPKRGAHWVERMWADHGNTIIDSVERFVKVYG